MGLLVLSFSASGDLLQKISEADELIHFHDLETSLFFPTRIAECHKLCFL
tara:strand:- start:184 stop:333 length:150 start_codon:yes stop_codon:yes gene_type:complete